VHPRFSERILARYAALKAVKGVEHARGWVIQRFGRRVYLDLVSRGGWKNAPRGGLCPDTRRLLERGLILAFEDPNTKPRPDRE